MEKQSVGQIVCEHRKKKGLTQKALAEQLNITDKAVSKWERDIARPDINIVPQLAEILDVPVEVLINIPLSPKSVDDSLSIPQIEAVSESVFDPQVNYLDELEQIEYKETAKKLLLKGLLGFLIAAVFVLFTMLSDNDDFKIEYAIIIGFAFSGVPYGWELLNRIMGNWCIVGSFPIVLIVFLLKFMGASFVGWIAYPIALFYAIAKAYPKGSPIRVVFFVLLVSFIMLIVTIFVTLLIVFIRASL